MWNFDDYYMSHNTVDILTTQLSGENAGNSVNSTESIKSIQTTVVDIISRSRTIATIVNIVAKQQIVRKLQPIPRTLIRLFHFESMKLKTYCPFACRRPLIQKYRICAFQVISIIKRIVVAFDNSWWLPHSVIITITRSTSSACNQNTANRCNAWCQSQSYQLGCVSQFLNSIMLSCSLKNIYTREHTTFATLSINVDIYLKTAIAYGALS